MKNYFRITLILVSIFAAFSSCKKNDFEGTSISFQSATCDFYGDPDWHNLFYYDLYLYDKNLTQNENGTGTMVYLALNCKITDNNMISSGTYDVNSSSTPKVFTFERGSWNTNQSTNENYVTGSYIGIVKNGQVTDYQLIVSGSATVNQNGNYIINVRVNTVDNKQYELKYTGAISITDMVVPLPNTLTKGEIWYWGNIYQNNMNVYTIRLGADDVALSTFSGSGDAMQIEVYTPSTSTTGIPTGTYPLKAIADNIINTSLAGEYNEKDNADYGTVYYTSDKLLVNEGTITITNNGNSNYNLDFNFKDDFYGYSIIDKFDMNLPLINRVAAAPKLARIQATKNKTQQRTDVKKSNKRFNRYEKSNKKNVNEMNKR